MGILGGAGEGGMLRLATGSFQRLTKAFPSSPIRLAATGEEGVGQFTGPKANETAQHSLLVGGCITVFGFKRSQQLDRRNIVPRTVFPAGGKATGAHQAEIGLGDDQWGFCDGGGEGLSSPSSSPQNRSEAPLRDEEENRLS